MVVASSKRSVMTLYSGALDPYSHRVRIVLAEKGVNFEVINVSSSTKAMEELVVFNPYGTIPTLVDRDLVLYQSEIIMEYLDERFPHPPLLPVYPVTKGRSRLIRYRVNHDWYRLMNKILTFPVKPAVVEQARMELVGSIICVIPIFEEMPFFLSEEFSLVDCCIAPLLWRLPKMRIQLPSQAVPILEYSRRIFQRRSFQASLSDAERTIRM